MAQPAVATVPSGRFAGRPARKFAPTRDGYRDIIFILMVLTLSRIHQHFHSLDAFRPLLLLVLAAGFYAVANPRMLALGEVVRSRTAKLMLALGVLACVSVPFGISMGNSAMFILTEYSKVLLFGFLVLIGIRDSRDLYKFIWAFVAAAGFLAWLSIFVFKMKAAKADDFVRIQGGYTYDSNDIGLLANLGLVFALLTLQISKTRGKLISLALLGCLGMTIAKTGSRGAFLTLMVVVGSLLVLLKNVSLDKKLAFVGVVGFGILLSAPQGYWEQMATMLAPTQDYNWTSETGRREVVIRGLGYMMMNPATGIGINNYGRAEGLISDRAQAWQEDKSLPGIKWSAAHNSFVEVAAEMGLTGLILFCMLIFGGILQCWRIRRSLPHGWARGDPEQQFLYYTSVYLPVALIAFSAGGALVSFAYLDPIYILAAFVGGLQTSVDKRLQYEAGLIGQQAGSHAPPVVQPRQRYRGGLPPLPAGGAMLPPMPPRSPGA